MVLLGAVEEVREVQVLVRVKEVKRLEKRLGGNEMRDPCRREQHTRNQNCSGHRLLRGETRICVSHQSFPTWRGRVRRGLVHLGRFAMEGSTSHYHIVVPRK